MNCHKLLFALLLSTLSCGGTTRSTESGAAPIEEPTTTKSDKTREPASKAEKRTFNMPEKKIDPECAEEDGFPTIECANEGKCSYQGGVCTAASEGDCLHSDACFIDGRCEAAEGSCVARTTPCKETIECFHLGRCERGESGTCEAKDLASCEASNLCHTQGLCDLNGKGGCQPSRDEHCRESLHCTKHGQCELAQAGDMFTCMPGGDEDCQKSDHCKSHGECRLGFMSCEK